MRSRQDILAAVSAVLVLTGAVRAEVVVVSQDFGAWTNGWSPDAVGDSPLGTYSNTGWTVEQGFLTEGWGSLWVPASSPTFAWLADDGEAADSALVTPLLANGAGSVQFLAMNRVNGTTYFEVEYSTNDTDWALLSAVTNEADLGVWKPYEVSLGLWYPLRLRIRKTGDSAGALRLGLDDVVVFNPAGARLTSLAHSPPSPQIDDSVHVSVDAEFHPVATDTGVLLHYRFEEDVAFSVRPMVLVSGTTYRTETAIPAGRAGTVYYRVEATYGGLDDESVFLPSGGVSNAASYTSVDPAGGEAPKRQFAPSSRGTPLMVSEIMYHPADRGDGLNVEFVEIYNTDPTTRDMGGYRLSGAIDYEFPEGTMLLPRTYLVVAKDPQAVSTLYPVTGVLGPYDGNLPNGGGTLRLRNRLDAVLLEIDYDDAMPWPVEADGAGHSLVCQAPDYGEGSVKAWGASQRVGGSPGYWLYEQTGALNNVVINEFLAHTDLPQDFIELYNHGEQVADLSGCVLTDDASTNKYTFPPATTLLSDDHLALDQDQLGFSLSMHGDDIYLIAADGPRVISAVRFGPRENGVTTGRTPDGAPELAELASPTAAASNGGLKDRVIVINEIMYHPISGDDDDEYVELYNRSGAPVDVGYWQFVDGINYMIPPGTMVPAGGYLVVARDAARLQTMYPRLNPTNLLGDFSGRLANRGERLRLAKPDDLASPFQDLVVVDEVTYGDGRRWGRWADGGGSSLELMDPDSDNRRAMNWRDSDETQKDTSTWTLVEHTGVLDHGRNSADEIQVLLERAGECLIDDIEVFKSGGPNLVPNSDFEAGLTSWVIQGNHIDSSLATGEGYQSNQSLHLRATGKGDNSVNRVETDLTTALASGDTATIRARVRWLCGGTNILLRLHGNWLETPGGLPVPSKLGTPGQQNSRYVSNGGPAIHAVMHAPVLPEANSPVTITARVHDPDGIQSLNVKWRDDPATTVNSVAMVDNGTGVDAISGDGIYSASVTGQPANDHVAFYIEAVDSLSATNRFPEGAPDVENLVYFGQAAPDTTFGVYRFWMTQAVQDEWTARQKLSDQPMPGTFIYGDCRVVYEAAGRFRGSPFIRRNGNPESLDSSFVLYAPKDDRLLGVTSFNMDRLELDNEQQRERLALWMADQVDTPTFNQRYTRLYIDEANRGLYGDAQQPNDDYMLSWWADEDDGNLHKIDDWFEFDDAAQVNREFNSNAQLLLYTTTGGVKKKARYRWSWRKEPVGSFNDNYATFFAMVDAQNLDHTSAAYAARVPAMVDFEEWMHVFGFRHMISDWDSYGFNRGKNMSTYRPDGGKWQMVMWDLDHRHFDGDASANNLFSINCPTMKNKFFAHPRFLRAYWRTLWELADGPMRAEACGPVMAQNYDALMSEGFSVAPPEPQLATWIETRRNVLIQQLETVAAPLEITTNGGANFTTVARIITLTGSAPVGIKDLRLNGETRDVTYPSTTTWDMQLELAPGANVLTIDGLLGNGSVATNAPRTITITYTGSAVSPVGQLVINEIMYHSPDPRSDFTEIHNLSESDTFHLGGMRLNGLNYTFDDGTFIDPGGFIVVADNTPSYAVTYGNAEVLAGDYPGELDNGGETISLLMPEGTNWVVLDRVRYDDSLPWPTSADGMGPSLQLIDAAEDNTRVANWGVDAVALSTPGAANSIAADRPPLPPVWINEIMPSNVSFAADTAGDFDPWIELYNAAGSPVDLGGDFYLTTDYTNLSMWAIPAGWSIDGLSHLMLWADAEPGETTATELHAGFVLPPRTGSVALVWTGAGAPLVLDSLDYAIVPANYSMGSYPDGSVPDRQIFHGPTPATANNATSMVVQVWINEWMARNSTTLEDPAAPGEFDDWVELYNAGANTVNLTGYHLTDDMARPEEFTIPLGASIAPGGFLVIWTDGDEDQNATGSVHTTFSLSGAGEEIALHAPDGTMVDAVSFGEQTSDVSEGRWLDGWPDVYQMAIPTPGDTNVILMVQSMALSGGGVDLEWPSRAGWSYQVMRSTDLSTNTTWSPMGAPVLGTGGTMSSNVPGGASLRIFYRVKQTGP